mmetsp:Transcript_2986/g.9777  ORF Transcript_2986/g.9777 Transcript_2986/m.9777 type:complete len:255 (-) Transcript_2986:95-859(-)
MSSKSDLERLAEVRARREAAKKEREAEEERARLAQQAQEAEHEGSADEATASGDAPSASPSSPSSSSSSSSAGKAKPGASLSGPGGYGEVVLSASSLPRCPVYCPVCTMPVELCSFGPVPAQCAAAAGVDVGDAAAAAGAKGGKRGGKAQLKPPPALVAAKAAASARAAATVRISVESRSRRKHVTLIFGLADFGVKGNQAKKSLSRKFASGVGIVKGKGGAAEHLEVQGDISYDLPDFLAAEFTIPVDSIVVE